MKKLLMIILSVVLLLAGTLVACDKGVGEDQKVVVKDGIEYTYDEKEDYYVVTKFSGTQTEIVIESELNKKAVGRIGPSAFKSSAIVKVTIPGSVKVINNDAFYLCKSLETVIIGEGTTSFDQKAFANCTKLSRFEAPSTIKAWGYQAFTGTPNLTMVHYAGTKNQFKENKPGSRVGFSEGVVFNCQGKDHVTLD